MTSNVRFKIKTYTDMLKYIDNELEKQEVISKINELLDLINENDFYEWDDSGNIDTFITEKCKKNIGSRIRRRELYEHYFLWCREQNQTVMPKKVFFDVIRSKGIRDTKYCGYNVFHGIEVNNDESNN